MRTCMMRPIGLVAGGCEWRMLVPTGVRGTSVLVILRGIDVQRPFWELWRCILKRLLLAATNKESLISLMTGNQMMECIAIDYACLRRLMPGIGLRIYLLKASARSSY